MEGVALEDLASSQGLIENQKHLIDALLQLDLSLDKQKFISNLVKVPTKLILLLL